MDPTPVRFSGRTFVAWVGGASAAFNLFGRFRARRWRSLSCPAGGGKSVGRPSATERYQVVTRPASSRRRGHAHDCETARSAA